jgi:DNA polymerase I-like protein with 3'-5' exonuclease and polymerase domains
MKRPIAVDFETSWTKDRSIGTHGTFNYLSHPDTKIFMVAIYGEGLSYVGDPEGAPWDEVRGNLVVAHNYTFEHAVLRECERRGIIKEPLNETGFCTADMSAYLQAPRNLLGAARELLGVSLDKTTRDKFKGKDFDTLPIDIQLEISNYALMDAKACFHLYKRYHHLWPEHEQKLADHTRIMGRRGINLDIERLEQGIRHYKEVLWGLEKLIPWSGEEKLLSPIALKNACRKAGIPAPESTAKNDESFQVWADEYSSKVPFVAAVSKYRSVNRSLEVLEAMKIRLVGERMQYGLKYCGAVPTFRWAGDSGLNCQNMPRNEVEGVNIRHMLVPAPGKKFISADMSQIEPRVSLYLTGDQEQLDLIRKGMCVYEAHGRQTLGYDLPISMKEAAKTDDKYNDLRQFCKARILGLNYGQYARGFQAYAKTFGINLTLEEARQQVEQFKKSNPLLASFWEKLEQGARFSRNETYEIELPSGRSMKYFDMRVTRGKYGAEFHARPVQGEAMTYYSFGKWHNNVCQGTARDVLGEAILRIENQIGLPIVLHVHDEVLVEVDEADAKDAQIEVARAMATSPDWMPGIPLTSDCKIFDRYEK